MECNERLRSHEEIMEELENAIHARDEQAKTDPAFLSVPCNGCTLCCHGDAIRILPEDDPTQFETVPHDHFANHLMIAHKPNGDCVYLQQGGCSVHGCKPQMCKTMDCRRLARMLKKKDLKKYNVPARVWNKGRQMIGRSF